MGNISIMIINSKSTSKIYQLKLLKRYVMLINGKQIMLNGFGLNCTWSVLVHIYVYYKF